MKTPKKETAPVFLEPHEVATLLNATDDPYYRAIFLFLLNTGLKISELLSLSENDILPVGNTAFIKVKGSHEHILVVNVNVVKEALKAGVFRRKVTARTIQRRLKMYARKAGIKKEVTPSVLRHTFAVLMKESGISINELQWSRKMNGQAKKLIVPRHVIYIFLPAGPACQFLPWLILPGCTEIFGDKLPFEDDFSEGVT